MNLKLNLKPSLILIMAGFVIGIFISALFSGCGDHSKNLHAVAIKELKQQRDSIDKKYHAEIASKEAHAIELAHRLEITTELLERAKDKTGKSESVIKQLIASKNREPVKIPTEQLFSQSIKYYEPQNQITPCDSLINVVSYYMDENHTKDSLYEAKIFYQGNLLSNKDSIIKTHSTAYNSLNQLFSQSLASQEQLAIENNRLQRRFKRQKLKNKLVSIGLMIISGYVTNYINHH